MRYASQYERTCAYCDCQWSEKLKAYKIEFSISLEEDHLTVNFSAWFIFLAVTDPVEISMIEQLNFQKLGKPNELLIHWAWVPPVHLDFLTIYRTPQHSFVLTMPTRYSDNDFICFQIPVVKLFGDWVNNGIIKLNDDWMKTEHTYQIG